MRVVTSFLFYTFRRKVCQRDRRATPHTDLRVGAAHSMFNGA
jgi:hypothetical protein